MSPQFRVCLCERVRVCECERVCVCVCVRERERDRETERERERERENLQIRDDSIEMQRSSYSVQTVQFIFLTPWCPIKVHCHMR